MASAESTFVIIFVGCCGGGARLEERRVKVGVGNAAIHMLR